MQPIIRLKNVNVIYGRGEASEVYAVRDTSLEIFPGEYIIFFGPSGSGKSTLLYTIAGLETANSGSVEVNGHELHAISESEMIAFHRSTIGMVFQAFYLVPHFTVLDNVCLPQMFEDKTREERETRAKGLIDRFGLTSISDHMPARMSGGQQQRTSIARALMNDPQIILADEPVGNLDSKNAEIVLDLLARVNAEEKRTIIQVTHNADDLVYADRVFYIKDGHIEKIQTNAHKKGASDRRQTQSVPEVRETQISARKIAEHLLHPYDSATEEKITAAIERYIKGGMSKGELAVLLDSKAGADLNTQTARHLSKEVADVVADMRAATEDSKVAHEHKHPKHVHDIRGHLIANSSAHMRKRQIERLDEAIEKRLSGEFTADAFFAALDAPESKGGVGLNSRTARTFTVKLDVMLGQK